MDDLGSETHLPSLHEPHDLSVVPLHPQPDASLVIRSAANSAVKFKVSTHVLTVASPYFAKLFGPNFTEGQLILEGKHPDIVLEEDEPDAMEIILSVLHHQPCIGSEALEPELLASVARHSDKYQCGKVLQPWASQWFSQVRGPTNAEEHGLLLSAAYLFVSATNFKSISAKIIRDLDVEFNIAWPAHSTISRLPERLCGIYPKRKMVFMKMFADYVSESLAASISNVLEKIHVELQAVEGRLQGQKAAYDMAYRLCPPCGRLHPANANQCRPCRNADLRDALCTHGLRIAEFFACLRESNLWPSVRVFETRAPAVIADQITEARFRLRHRCKEGSHCPLIFEVDQLSKRAAEIVSNIRGFDIEGWEDDSADSFIGI